MELVLPNKTNSQEAISIESNCIVIIGANGSGKTRFGRDIEQRYDSQTHRISAQKSLSMPREVSPKSRPRAEAEFLYGAYDENNPNNNLRFKIGSRWGQNPNTFLLDDYEKLMVLLHTDEYEESIKFKENYIPGQEQEKPYTKLDQVKDIWEYVLPHRKLVIKAGYIETYPIENTGGRYNSSEMSDGERVVFYLIGEVVSVKENSIVVIDEPEMHIHKAITKKLWDKIEQERPDCTFIYLTHDIDFASSRIGSTKIWAKSFDGACWAYEILDGDQELPEQLYLEILGSRKPILFIEGDDSSIDHRILQLVFTDHTTKPVGSCDKVLQITKSFNDQRGFHNIESFGLIDRDRRTEDEIEHIRNPNIWVASVSEIENFLLLEDIVKIVAKYMMKDPGTVFSTVKENVISFFNTQLDKQALEHTVSRIERIFKTITDNSAVKEFNELEASLNEFWDNKDFEGIYSEIKSNFETIVQTEDYDKILGLFNNKGLIHNSNVTLLCDLSTKNDAYLNYILGLLKKNNDDSEVIRQVIINKIEKNT